MLINRPRRNRKSAAIRDLVQETTLSVNDFIFPMFVMEGSGIKSEIKSMPNIFQITQNLKKTNTLPKVIILIRCISGL
jgi:porphobilinogen synthase